MSKCAKEIEQELLKVNKAWEQKFEKMIQNMVQNGLKINLEDFES
ncbi:hypothetical protein [Spiroplasma endosymbiont of Panorpa germanica]